MEGVGAMIDEDDTQLVVDSFIKSQTLVQNQIDSFEYFCSTQLPSIIRETSCLEKFDNENLAHRLEFLDVHLTKPRTREANGFVRQAMSPHETAIRGQTYCSDILVDVSYSTFRKDEEPKDENTKIYTGVEMCKIPMMVGSRYCTTKNGCDTRLRCTMDTGGYFVVNSSEKTVICQEKLAINRCFVWQRKGKDKFVCEIRSCHEEKLRSTSTMYIRLREFGNGQIPHVAVDIPFVDSPATVSQVFKMLGCKTASEMITVIVGEEDPPELLHLANNIIEKDMDASNGTEAMENLAVASQVHTDLNKSRSYIQHIFECEVLPHVGLDMKPETMLAKRTFFGFMVRRLLRVFLQIDKPDDRDHYFNKRIDGAGMLMSFLFRQLWRQFLKVLSNNLAKNIQSNKSLNIPDMLKATKVSSGMLYAFATGSWGVSKSNGDRSGVVQMMNRASYSSALAGLRRINTPVNKDSKSPPVRQLHTSSWGVVCATETPEGASCGLIKNLALMARIRVGCKSKTIMNILSRTPSFKPLTSNENLWSADLFVLAVNGHFVGKVEKKTGVAHLTKLKRYGALPVDTSVSFSDEWGLIEIDTDPGALCRPVMCTDSAAEIKTVIARYKSLPNNALFDELLHHGHIMYLDKKEERNLKVSQTYEQALRQGAPYFEIHPCCILGLCANLIPFANHNQAPRNTYQAAMGKQALGLPSCNCMNRFDTVTHVLNAPHRPMVDTTISNYIGMPILPSGQNFVVAIMSYSGFNQEDSIIVNAGALERGLGRCDSFRSYKYDVPLTGQDKFRVAKPDDDVKGKKFGNYNKINKNGLPAVGTELQNGDVIIGVVVESKTDIRDNSIIYRHGPSVVDAAWVCINKDGKQRVVIRTREHRLPRPGDKFSSRHGQKGVIGKVIEHADMPYRKDGLVPDIIVNPHAIPSRMTIGHLLETLLGTAAVIAGTVADGSSFRNVSITEIQKECEALIEKNNDGVIMDGLCRSKMICGISGRELKTQCFVGITWYQKLKHMVRDKEHVRTTGPVAIMTRQPLEGRSRGGGLRFGEMELQCLLAYGCAHNTQEFLFAKSDPYRAFYCRKCGDLCEPPCSDAKVHVVRGKRAYCRQCQSFSHISRIPLPYSGKLFLQELAAANIRARLMITPDEKNFF